MANFISAMVQLETGAYEFGLTPDTMLSGFFSVVTQNITPILTVMGVMLGVTWVVRYFNKARKGKI